MPQNRFPIRPPHPSGLLQETSLMLRVVGQAHLAKRTSIFRLVCVAGLLCLAQMLTYPATAQELAVAKIGTAAPLDANTKREFYGRVVALETVDLALQVGGQIVEFPVREGAVIERGTLIAALDLVPLELSLSQAQAQFDQAQRTLERLEQLSGSTVSQASVDDARTNFDLAKIALESAERSLGQGQLLAPFDALVSSRLVANRTTVSAGAPIVRLHDMSEIRIEISVPEVLFQSAGRELDVELFAKFPASEERFPLELREYNAETASVGQTYTITLGMAPPEDLIVLPGSSALVEAWIGTDQPNLTIPRSALVFAADGTPQVMLFNPTAGRQGTVSLTEVEIQPTATGDVEVISGLESGQEFVAAGASQLQAGQTVVRFTGFGQ